MGFKLGGFVCDGCSTFQQYNDGRSVSDHESVEVLIPDGWTVIDRKVIDGWVSTGNSIVICCDRCSRSLKINKIKHDVQSKIQKSKECQC